MVVFGFLCDTTCRRRPPRTQLDMSAPRVMSSGQTQVSLGERWLIWGAGRQRNSQDNPSVLLHQLVPTWGWKRHTLSINEWDKQSAFLTINQLERFLSYRWAAQGCGTARCPLADASRSLALWCLLRSGDSHWRSHHCLCQSRTLSPVKTTRNCTLNDLAMRSEPLIQHFEWR